MSLEFELYEVTQEISRASKAIREAMEEYTRANSNYVLVERRGREVLNKFIEQTIRPVSKKMGFLLETICKSMINDGRLYLEVDMGKIRHLP